MEKYDLLMLLFDIPVKTKKQQKAYREFMKYIRGEGYTRFQDSVYLRVCCNNSIVDGECARLRKCAPAGAEIQLLSLTERMFERLRLISGNRFDVKQITDSLIII